MINNAYKCTWFNIALILTAVSQYLLFLRICKTVHTCWWICWVESSRGGFVTIIGAIYLQNRLGKPSKKSSGKTRDHVPTGREGG